MIASWDKKKSWSEDFMLKGYVKFIPLPYCVRVYIYLKGLKPGKHGIHIHENGMFCEEQLQTTNPCNCTHGHFNPTNDVHGKHVGDLCFNIESNENKEVYFEYDDYKLIDYYHLLPGKTIVIHENEDNLGILKGNTDPESLKSGKAGNRIACAEIFQKKN